MANRCDLRHTSCNARFNKNVAIYVHSEVEHLAIGHSEVSGATGSVLYNIALWNYFGDVALLSLAVTRLRGKLDLISYPKQSHSAIQQHRPSPTQPQNEYLSRHVTFIRATVGVRVNNRAGG